MSTYHAASLIELLHTATLIHDDVVDESYERRGYFSINAIWKSKVAVLIGDFLLSRGLLMAVEKKEYDLLEIVSGAVREMSEGELLQIQKSRKLNITREQYFEIIRKKTAMLIAACCQSGARSVGVNHDILHRMQSFGLNAGIAFQIKDDLFDYQKRGITGKPTGNDIKEKKFTLPLIYALDQSSNSEKREIINIIRKKNNNHASIDRILQFVDEKNGLAYSEEMMMEYRNKALNILRDFPRNEARNALEGLVCYTVSRKK